MLRVGIVLAGGAGRRFGRDKVVALVDGEVSVSRVARVLRAAGAGRVYVSVRDEYKCKIYTSLSGADGCVYDPSWLRCGGPAAALAGLGGLEGARLFFLAPADMPWLRPSVYLWLEAFMGLTGAEAAVMVHEEGSVETLVAAMRGSLVGRLPSILGELCRLRGKIRVSDAYRSARRLVVVGSGLLSESGSTFTHINTVESLKTRCSERRLGPKLVTVVEPLLEIQDSKKGLCSLLEREEKLYSRLGLDLFRSQVAGDRRVLCKHFS